MTDQEIRHITPPKLNDVHLGEKIVCYRPLRHGSPNLSVELRGKQVLAHHYGHGGSGWVLAPGSAQYVNQLLINSPYASELKKNSPICIIGAGVMGLFSAYDLIQRGYQDITVVAEQCNQLASHNAGGLLALISMNNDTTAQKLVETIGCESYHFYSKICHEIHPDFKSGALILPAYFPDHKNGLETYVGKVMKPAKTVILDFGTGTQRSMVAYDDCIFIDTPAMMTSLHDYLKSKIKFIQQKIMDFKEIDQQFIINCTGQGAGVLNTDPAVVTVQGHLIMLKNQNPAELQYMITNDHYQTSDSKIKRAVYMFPKHLPGTDPSDVGVIGGTFIEGATADTPHYEEFDLLIERVKDFLWCFPILIKAFLA